MSSVCLESMISHMISSMIDRIAFSPGWLLLAGVVIMWILIEWWHHRYSIAIVRGIDALYEKTELDREVDIVDQPAHEEFGEYMKSWHDEHKFYLEKFARKGGACFHDLLNRAQRHVSEDYAHTVDVAECIPTTILFRTLNSVRNFSSRRMLEKNGFKSMHLPHVHLYYYTRDSGRKLLLIFPQFSGEFRHLATFAELRDQYDILLVCPLGIQFTWSQVPARHSDSLQEYLPFVLRYEKIVAVAWSAGSVPFQILDRYLELKGMRDKIEAVVRLDPIGHPTSNYTFYTGVMLPWLGLWRHFLDLGTNQGKLKWWQVDFVSHFGCLGFAYLLKTAHGYTYFKAGRFLRCTKMTVAPYQEYQFTATFDPLWNSGHPFFDFDRKFFHAETVSEKFMKGFHGLWLNGERIREHVFPVLNKLAA